MSELRVPQLGESVVEATIARWVKKPGDQVQVGEAVVELETEKVNVEVAAEEAGTLQQILHEEGATVKVGEVLGIIGDGAASPTPAPPTSAAAPETPGPQPPGSAGVPPHPPPEAGGTPALPGQQPDSVEGASHGPAHTPAAAPAPAPSTEEVHVTPVARRVAEEHGIDPASVQGSGPGGRITKEDVLEKVQGAGSPSPAAAAAGQAPDVARGLVPRPASPAGETPALPGGGQQGGADGQGPAAAPGAADAGRPEEHVRLSRRRLTIARRLVEAQQTAAMLTTFNEVDMSAVMEVRKRRRDSFKERHGVNLGFMSFFTKASVGALKAFPPVNGELRGDTLVLKRYYDIGIAVSTEEGLVVPVLRDADKLTFAGIEKGIADLATRARERKLTLDELQGGTFTITNGGVFGSLLSTPILNPPQVAILGMHKIEERPIALNGEVVIRPMMYLALSYDHRVIDGKEAVSFLVRIKELIEDPETLLLEG